MNVLVLGVTGMLGSTVFHTFNQTDAKVYGTLRDRKSVQYFPEHTHANLIPNIDVLDIDTLFRLFELIRPDVVINCIGLIKQLAAAKDPLLTLPINAMLPHRLAKFCALSNARLIHISTDCVFSGRKGLYLEQDVSDAEDLYGKSKYIGEVTELSHAITLRTSIIGHEISSNYALLEWFLSQENQVNGYTKAIFSGFPTVELARIIRDYVIPCPELHGLYHVAASPINKFDLLTLIAEIYKKKIRIILDEQIVIDRSLNGERFRAATGYIAPSWPELIEGMYETRKLYGAK
ncbi:dTDP-4-dehydrorhamnose reductase family protein [Legionella tucsonensis]|uniref:dTDP-4-dehydrorhamnose reductase n=1 Tax=Legionella tucsonensis TaxID=40335 RepID=A0A0W0ZSQ1_9GAMM|nr:SDR family oxidoreductase [Legionella tucsonensis]KTD72229.1 dTDP-4-dehydrorhamnose reductase [Legionella tucsonensis]